jgi:hypothetical protein
MTRRWLSRKAELTALLVVGAVGTAAFLWAKWGGHRGDATPSAERAIFLERAREAGLDFRMAFLPGEQGETFKINLYDHGCGVAVGDYDGDGHDDVFFCNQLGPCALFRNKGDGTFEDVTHKAGVALGDRVCVAATFADYDNDGHQDLFVTSTRGGNVLFHNNGNGTFTDLTASAGVGHVGHSQAAVFFDFDNDGLLDLLVTNTAQWTTDDFDTQGRYYRGTSLKDVPRPTKEENVLYRNKGDGTFEDVTAKAGLKGKGWSGDVAVFDFDGDGHLDVLITSMFGRSQLYRNNGDGTFTDVTAETLGRTPFGAVGARVFDFDNDGRLDLFLTDMHSDMWMGLDYEHRSHPLASRWAGKKLPSAFGGPLAEQTADEIRFLRSLGTGPEEVFFGNALYRNLGGKKFAEVSDRAGLETFWPWGSAAGDFDNDGHEDVFITAGMGYPFYYWPNSLMHNNGDGTFTDRAADLGIEPPSRGLYLDEKIRGMACPRSSRSAACADFDGDGRLDLVVNNFNDRPYYFRNRLPPRNYLALRLQGTRSNRDAIGAVVRLYAGKEVMTRQVSPASGYLAQSSRTVHFGLGDRAQIDRVEIVWPSGTVQHLASPALNTCHACIEDAPARRK